MIGWKATAVIVLRRKNVKRVCMGIVEKLCENLYHSVETANRHMTDMMNGEVSSTGLRKFSVNIYGNICRTIRIE